MNENVTKTDFANRVTECQQLLRPPPLLNIYGEYGIGKSRLLEHVVTQWRNHGKAAFIDLSKTRGDLGSILAECTEQLSEEKSRQNDTGQDSLEYQAGVLLREVRSLAETCPVYLIFDNTECLQSNAAFWNWMEVNIVGPLLSEPQVKQIFAGRIPVPWRRAEVRLSVELLRIERIPEKDESQLIRSAVAARSEWQPEAVPTHWVTAIARLSYGLPRLVEVLAETVVQTVGAQQANEADLERQLAERVKRFIYDDLFRDVEPDWREILWWACVPERFDAGSLKAYLEEVRPDLAKRDEYYYIKGIQDLRLHYMVVSADAQGNRLSGVLQEIVRGCFRRVAPADFTRAEQAWQAWIERRQPEEAV